MSDTAFVGSLFHDRLRTASKSMLWTGLAMAALGAAAIIFPMMSTLVATFFVGWILLFSGAFGFLGAFSIHGTGPFFGALLLGLLSIAAGVFLLFSPLAGAVALTLMVGGIFIVQGAFEISFAFEMRPDNRWVWMLISGIISLLLAIFIIATWPAISLILLGIVIGVNFLSTGLGYVFASRMMKA